MTRTLSPGSTRGWGRRSFEDFQLRLHLRSVLRLCCLYGHHLRCSAGVILLGVIHHLVDHRPPLVVCVTHGFDYTALDVSYHPFHYGHVIENCTVCDFIVVKPIAASLFRPTRLQYQHI